MCGIVGICGKCDEETVRTMMSRMVHRGPDSKGILWEPERLAVLGHRRLAIMDPAGGDQPIFSEDGYRAIVANGAIYNFASLRSRLEDRYRFQTRSDSEAALALYSERGHACVSDLDGMPSFFREKIIDEVFFH